MRSVIDAHLDLAYIAQQGVDLRVPSSDRTRFGVNFPALAAGGVRLAFATIFTEAIEPPVGRSLAPWEYESSESKSVGPSQTVSTARSSTGAERAGLDQLAMYLDWWTRGVVRVIDTRAALDEVPVAGAPRSGEVPQVRDDPSVVVPPSIVLLMEGADPITSPDRLVDWVGLGVRAIGLSWAKGSRYAGGNACPGPLTDLGRALLADMERLGVMLDLSHLSDEAFDGALEHFAGPVMASHSNARALLEPSPRHLTDEQAQRIAQRGGVIGLNLYGRFLASGRRATIDDAVRHLEHWRERVGVDHLGIGSDFDGGFGPADCPEGLGRPEELPRLFDALQRRGWSDPEINAVAFDSWMQFLRRSLPDTATAATH